MDTPKGLMREEERRNVSENHDWSKLYPDLLRSILESLNSIDFHRAKTVCSDWYSIWKTCVKRPLCPWRITYVKDSLMLLNPGEDKIYKGTNVGLSNDSYYMTSSGNWLLMVDSNLGFYIFNLLTYKRIDLPSMESSIRGGNVRFERNREDGFSEWGHFVDPCRKDYVGKDIMICRRSAVLWIDERTGDYVVAWIYDNHYLFLYKKGDDSWWNWNDHWNMGSLNLSFLDLAYRNSKLYLYTTNGHIKIVDFSRNDPIEVIEKNPYLEHPFRYFSKEGEYICKTRMAIQKSGEVLIILSVFELISERKLLFYIFKMNLESNIWERVESIGDDEMLIFGHGVTIRAPVQDVGDDGIKSGSIYFAVDDLQPIYYHAVSNCGVFDLATSIIKWPKEDSFNNRFVKTQWFVPGFA
ncbi:putative F-box protein At5g38270 [Arabidopsis lyrata subsp. lyrata]|uniref:putative F-box protein At5g38270 n=1 Tax=Arabidopsis lyrata subsp. lyrata TaxID=81972 RepID=UPI000A29D44C|nr:putative F-box protein At5g38270 [Arabidopsis lyrata subsp. lyrata]|eukprot:XP_020874590.1 putative F-box protein At5g38270 [Arabidopsis lyrata subsp. lyrata]